MGNSHEMDDRAKRLIRGAVPNRSTTRLVKWSGASAGLARRERDKVKTKNRIEKSK